MSELGEVKGLVVNLHGYIEKLEDENKDYRKVLEFYANPENYEREFDSFSDTGRAKSKVEQDKGHKARESLKGRSK